MLNRLKISLVLTPIALLLLVGVYIYTLWAAERQKTTDIPVEAVGTMMRDLVSFYEKRGGFPVDLRQLEGVVWEKKEDREFSINSRGFNHRNYLYLYTRITPHRFTLWAIPVGKLREEAPTWFLSVTPAVCRRWKGAALTFEYVEKISFDPSPNQLGLLGLTEQSVMNLAAAKKTSFRSQFTTRKIPGPYCLHCSM